MSADSQLSSQPATPSGDAPSLLATRASLLGRLKDLENRTSWQEFFDTYWRLIYSTARKAGLTPEEAQDAMQDTFLAVAKNIGGFQYDRKKCTFKSWLLLITRQRIIWQWRRRPPPGAAGGREGSPSPDDRTSTIERIPDEAAQAIDAHWEAEWKGNLMAAALERVKRQVKSKQFQVFELYAIQEWPAPEVARVLKISIAQVYLIKHRLGALLKKELKQLAKEP